MSYKLISGLLGTIYKMPEADVAAALPKADGSDEVDEEKALALIIQKDKERIEKIKTDNSTKWDDAIKKATGQVWSKVEKTLKDRFDVDSELQGEELLEFIVENKKPDGKPLTDDEVKSHPVFMKTIKELNKKLEEKDKEKEAALKEAQENFTQKEIFSEVRKEALMAFDKLGEAILPADARKADMMKQRLLIDELNQYDYTKQDGKFLPRYKAGTKDKNGNDIGGKFVEDEHGYAMEFEDLVSKKAKENFEFKTSKDRQSPNNADNNNPPRKEQKEKKYQGKAPANQREYVGLLTDDSLSPDQKIEIKEQYGEQFSKN